MLFYCSCTPQALPAVGLKFRVERLEFRDGRGVSSFKFQVFSPLPYSQLLCFTRRRPWFSRRDAEFSLPSWFLVRSLVPFSDCTSGICPRWDSMWRDVPCPHRLGNAHHIVTLQVHQPICVRCFCIYCIWSYSIRLTSAHNVHSAQSEHYTHTSYIRMFAILP